MYFKLYNINYSPMLNLKKNPVWKKIKETVSPMLMEHSKHQCVKMCNNNDATE